MKKYITLLLIVLTGALQGIKAQTKIDQIFKVDRSAFKCKVDEISETDVYFMMLDDPTKKRQMLPKKTLWKIVFFDGAEELINEPAEEVKPTKDLIYKKDKSVVECKILRITEKIIEYRMNASEASPLREIERKLVSKITYADGTTESMDGKKLSKKDAKSSDKPAKDAKALDKSQAPDAPVKVEEEVETKKKGLFKWGKKVQEPKKPKVKEPELWNSSKDVFTSPVNLKF